MQQKIVNRQTKLIADKDRQLEELKQQLVQQKEDFIANHKQILAFIQDQRDKEATTAKEKFDYICKQQEKQIQELKEELKQKQQEWLSMFKDLYNLSKKPDFHTQLKTKLESINTSIQQSQLVSPQQSPVPQYDYQTSVPEQPLNVAEIMLTNSINTQFLQKRLHRESFGRIEQSIEGFQVKKGKTLSGKSKSVICSHDSCPLNKRDIKAKHKKNQKLQQARKQQTAEIVEYLEKNKQHLTTIQEINQKLFAKFPEEHQLKLESIDEMFCDGLLFPKTQLSDTIVSVQHLFEEYGLVVKTVKPSMQQGYWFVKMNEDACPSLDILKKKLLLVMQNFRTQLKQHSYADNVFLKQFDCTCDYKGYFVCNDVRKFIDKFKSMGLTNTRKYKSISTCVHLVNKVQNELDMRSSTIAKRYKIYNKTVHPLFATESVQKKIGMGTSAFFHCSTKFYQRWKNTSIYISGEV